MFVANTMFILRCCVVISLFIHNFHFAHFLYKKLIRGDLGREKNVNVKGLKERHWGISLQHMEYGRYMTS